MKRLIIIGEGQTEQVFLNDILVPHFFSRDIALYSPTTKQKSGGIVKWSALRHQIILHLKQDTAVTVSTMIDYYGMYAHHQYPAWELATNLSDKHAALETIENGMYMDIPENLRARFIPYIQLHEFESLLFSSISPFEQCFERSEFIDYNYLLETIDQFPNPELINDGLETAPSKRLERILKGYKKNKSSLGPLIAQELSLQTIRAKCNRFNQWINKLEQHF